MKEHLLQALMNLIKDEISSLSEAHSSVQSFATDQEFKAESKYDTRSLEASYLASAEARRIEELNQDLQMLEEMDLNESSVIKEVCSGSLVTLEFNNISKKYFLVPISGGNLLESEDGPVLVISVFSPIGSAVLGLKVGDEFEVETPREIRNYRVTHFI